MVVIMIPVALHSCNNVFCPFYSNSNNLSNIVKCSELILYRLYSQLVFLFKSL